MDNIDIFFRAALMGFALILFVISVISYSRVKNRRLLYVCTAFGLFLLKGILLTLGIFISSLRESLSSSTEMIILDFLILFILYMGLTRKTKE